MSEGVGKCLVSRAEGQPVRVSTYDEAEDNGIMIIFGDNGIVMYDVKTQSSMHKASWDFQPSLSRFSLGSGMSAVSVTTYATGTDGSAIQLIFKDKHGATIADIQFYSVGILYRSGSLEKRIAWQQPSLSQLNGRMANGRLSFSWEYGSGVTGLRIKIDGNNVAFIGAGASVTGNQLTEGYPSHDPS